MWIRVASGARGGRAGAWRHELLWRQNNNKTTTPPTTTTTATTATNNIKRVDFGVPTSWFLGAQMLTSSKPIYFWWLCDQSLFISVSTSCLKRAVYYLGSAIKAYLFLDQNVHNLLNLKLEIVSKSIKIWKSAKFGPIEIHRLVTISVGNLDSRLY